MRPPRYESAKDVLRVACGSVLNPRYSALSREEQAAVLEPHRLVVESAEAALGQLLTEAAGQGMSEAHAKLRKADALDPQVVDEVMQADEMPADAFPIEVPRRPWPGGL